MTDDKLWENQPYIIGAVERDFILNQTLWELSTKQLDFELEISI